MSGDDVDEAQSDWITELLFGAVEGTGRRERTRNALLQAGLSLMASGDTEVPVLRITQTAGVSNGSFYNFFTDKQSFFNQSADFAAERLAALLDRDENVAGGATGVTTEADSASGIAATVCTNFRLVGRAHRLAPVLSRVLIGRSAAYYSAGGGFISRIRRDIAVGVESGSFRISDPEGVVGTLVGAMVMLGQRLHDNPALDAGATTDGVARDVLRLLGVPDEEAERLMEMPLPFGLPVGSGSSASRRSGQPQS